MYQSSTQAATGKTCPHCGTTIRQDQTSCGAGPCRQKVYRINKADRLRREQQAARDAVREYCATYLPPEFSQIVQAATELLIDDEEEGYIQARKLIEAIDLKRCKHEKIAILENNAANARHALEEARTYNKQLEALYKAHIAELEEEVRLYQVNEIAIHQIAQEQLAQQSE
jgi:hypothetical protein